jgi:hypothetical protein
MGALLEIGRADYIRAWGFRLGAWSAVTVQAGRSGSAADIVAGLKP